jgi:hypothetical protein
MLALDIDLLYSDKTTTCNVGKAGNPAMYTFIYSENASKAHILAMCIFMYSGGLSSLIFIS